MSHVVAILDQSTFKVFSSAAEAPPSAAIFSSPAELASALSAGAMDRVRGLLLGEEVEQSPTRELAAARLWVTFGEPPHQSSSRYVVATDKLGNRKFPQVGEVELLQLAWVPGKDWTVDRNVARLCPQGKQILLMLVEDGRKIWTNQQIDAAVYSRSVEVQTRQEFPAVWKFYSQKFTTWRILRRVSYLEFATSQEFEGISLIKEGLCRSDS